MKKLATALLLLSFIHIAGAQTSQAPKSQPTVTFRDITAQSGIHFVHNNAAFGKKYLPETMGPGVAFIDYDNDGWPDIFLVNGTNWPGQPSKHSTPKLYHNNRNGTFTDVTQKSGLLGPKEFSTSAAWVDYDKDGKLDLVVANYVQWSVETDLYCTLDGKSKSYCTPESYKGTSVRLWHNRGDGTFEDATKKAVLAGVGRSDNSVARAGMGVDAADYDHSGLPSILITNFSNQMVSLYHNEGKGLFVDEAPRSDVGRASLLTLGFGCFFFDYDLDGWPDIFIANGHIDSNIERVQPNVKYAMPPHVFRNAGKGNFQEVAKSLGHSFNTPRVGRGAAYADINNDGRLDLLLSTNGGSAYLFLNEATGSAASNKSLRIKLVGTKSNRDGIGAVAKISAGGETQTQMLRSGSSYLSASELILTFGLAQNSQADSLEIHWPSGQLDKLSNIPANQTITITESIGQTASRKFSTN